MIGEIKTSKELGLLGHSKYIYEVCVDCHQPRWTTLYKGSVKNLRCRQCASIESNSRAEVRNKISAANKGHKSWNKGVPHTEETKKKMSEAHPDNSGEKNANWKGGVSAHWAEANRERSKELNLNYRNKHKLKLSRIRSEKYYTDINYRLRSLIRRRLKLAMKYEFKTGTALKYLGCSLEQLRSHLESKFTAGMSWNNCGKWHIDHIKPLSSFDLSDEIQLQQAVHYTNLQPLWALDNLKKGSKILVSEVQHQ